MTKIPKELWVNVSKIEKQYRKEKEAWEQEHIQFKETVKDLRNPLSWELKGFNSNSRKDELHVFIFGASSYDGAKV